MLYKGMSVNHLAVTNFGADGAGEGGFASSPNIWYLCKNGRNKLDMTKRIFPMAAPTGNDKPKDKWKPENIHYDKW